MSTVSRRKGDYRSVPSKIRLQNLVRNTINVTMPSGEKQGVEPQVLRRALRVSYLPYDRITVRAERLPARTGLWSDYKLWLDGELLFRLKLVPWDRPCGGARWHVKRHPEASWWRRDGKAVRTAGRRPPRQATT